MSNVGSIPRTGEKKVKELDEVGKEAQDFKASLCYIVRASLYYTVSTRPDPVSRKKQNDKA